jgi:hypothetical protein
MRLTIGMGALHGVGLAPDASRESDCHSTKRFCASIAGKKAATQKRRRSPGGMLSNLVDDRWEIDRRAQRRCLGALAIGTEIGQDQSPIIRINDGSLYVEHAAERQFIVKVQHRRVRAPRSSKGTRHKQLQFSAPMKFVR